MSYLLCDLGVFLSPCTHRQETSFEHHHSIQLMSPNFCGALVQEIEPENENEGTILQKMKITKIIYLETRDKMEFIDIKFMIFG